MATMCSDRQATPGALKRLGRWCAAALGRLWGDCAAFSEPNRELHGQSGRGWAGNSGAARSRVISRDSPRIRSRKLIWRYQRTDIDVIDELITDHREALELLDRTTSITEPDQRREPADTVISEVVWHTVAEEMYVYPAMREHLPDGDQAVEHDTEEHQQLETVPPSERRFDALVRDMTEKLRHRAHSEETEQFPHSAALDAVREAGHVAREGGCREEGGADPNSPAPVVVSRPEAG